MIRRRILRSPPNSEGINNSDLKEQAVIIMKSPKTTRPSSSHGIMADEVLIIGKHCKRSKSDSSLDTQASKKRKPFRTVINSSKVPFTIHEDASDENENTKVLAAMCKENERLPGCSSDMNDQVTSVEPDWKLIAEKRRIALSEVLFENRQLHDMLNALKEENLQLLDTAAKVELLTQFIEENVDHLTEFPVDTDKE